MIGYAANSAGYKIRPDTGSIITACNVIFDERPTAGRTPAPTPEPSPGGTAPEVPPPKPTATRASPTTLLIDTDDTESVGEPQPDEPTPPSPPIAQRRTQRAAAGRPASMWQDDAYRITGRTTAATAIATSAVPTQPPAQPADPPKLSKPTPPPTLEAAPASPEADRWCEAIADELASLHEKGTWTLERPPPGTKPIPLKWVFDYKLDATGAITRYKARLVAKGQKKGID